MDSVKSKEMDMLNGGLAGKLILFAMPLAFSSILQQLFNSADVAVVGRFAGDNALAAAWLWWAYSLILSWDFR